MSPLFFCKAYQHGVKVKDINTKNPLTRSELIQRIKDWANDPSQANANAITDANTSEITDMSNLFYSGTYTGLSWEATENIRGFNLNISAWDTSFVTNMSEMFFANTAFNQPIGGWNTSSVTDMSLMFLENFLFNQSIENWDISSVDNFKDFATILALDEEHNPFLK